MKAEEKIIDFVCDRRFEDLPKSALETIKNQLLAITGTTLAGATEDGCEEAVRFYQKLGGKREATVLVYGGKIPAHDAAFVNAAMARALDFCDAIAPGPHIGAALIPASLALSELVGGISGRDFLASLVIGAEVAARLNLSEAAYNGFDPTGICVIFGVASAASRILGLSREETWNALALSFNRCGGSFQSHIGGSLAVRFVQGWVSQGAIVCARLASEGITGPKNFLEGVYGYLHLYGKNLFKSEDIVADLGQRYALENIVFKKYPCCGLTQGPTDVTLQLMAEEKISAEDIDRIHITVPPYTHKLVGHEFKIGDNPRVDSQFSIQYCVANALVRGSSSLDHFGESAVRDEKVLEIVGKIKVIPDEAMEARGHTPLDMRVWTREGRELFRQMDIAPGFPGNPLTHEDHQRRFQDCLNFAKKPVSEERATELISFIQDFEKVKDVRKFVKLLLL
jgi:2-methylcitrate dehydratase PrpD